MTDEVFQESIFVPVDGTDELHLRRIWRDPNGPPVFMVHGSIENGRVFYSPSGRGVGPYLARNGYDVYVGDLRGRGLSRPPIGRHSQYGQTEMITEDIPAMVREIRRRRGDSPQYWIGHSWGGVLLMSHLARSEENRSLVRSMVLFATKRTIRTQHLEKWLKIDLFWNRISRLLVRLCGYLPARELRLGMDNETDRSHLQCKLWVDPSGPWIDPPEAPDSKDRFDYGAAIRTIEVPPTLHMTGAGDRFLGHPNDVLDFFQEVGGRRDRFHLLSRGGGHLHDYGHTDILTHPDAVKDHFPLVLRWFQDDRIF